MIQDNEAVRELHMRAISMQRRGLIIASVACSIIAFVFAIRVSFPEIYPGNSIYNWLLFFSSPIVLVSILVSIAWFYFRQYQVLHSKYINLNLLHYIEINTQRLFETLLSSNLPSDKIPEVLRIIFTEKLKVISVIDAEKTADSETNQIANLINSAINSISNLAKKG